jgi:hypothetical protein
MKEYGLHTWLLITAAISLPLIIGLWIDQIRRRYIWLKKECTLRPLSVLIKQLGIIKALLFPLNMLPHTLLKNIECLKGRKVWLQWDIKWIGGGVTTGEIDSVYENSDKHMLLINIDKPIMLKNPKGLHEISISRIVFTPFNNTTNTLQYKLRSIGGTLLPEKEIGEVKHLISNGRLATCNIVVY